MSWSPKGIFAALGIPFGVVPGRPLACETSGVRDGGIELFGAKAEVHLFGDGNILELDVTSWSATMMAPTPGKDIFLVQKKQVVAIERLLHARLVRNRAGDFEFETASVAGKADLPVSPSYQKGIVNAFRDAAGKIAGGLIPEEGQILLSMVSGDSLGSFAMACPADKWKESVPEAARPVVRAPAVPRLIPE